MANKWEEVVHQKELYVLGKPEPVTVRIAKALHEAYEDGIRDGKIAAFEEIASMIGQNHQQPNLGQVIRQCEYRAAALRSTIPVAGENNNV